MGWVEYETGVVAPDGYAERWNSYICDVPGCRAEAVVPWGFGDTYSGLCENHIEEAQEADATEQTEPESDVLEETVTDERREGKTWRDYFNSACRKNFKRMTIEELLAWGAWSDFMARGGPDPRIERKEQPNGR